MTDGSFWKQMGGVALLATVAYVVPAILSRDYKFLIGLGLVAVGLVALSVLSKKM